VWLLDEGLPVPLFTCLKRLGIEVQTTEFREWKGLRNGDLVEVAADAGFVAILTKDRLFAQDAAKALVKYPTMAIVLVQLPQKPRQQYIEIFEAHWRKSKIMPMRLSA
jgi:hypothetical protein